MPIGHMGFANIEEEKHGLAGRRGGQLGLDPGQLGRQAPGVAGEVEALEGGSEHAARFTGRIEPVHGAAAEGAVAEAAKPLDQIGSLKPETALAISAGMAGIGHAEELAGLGIEPGLSAAGDPRREPHPEGSVAAVGEVTGGQGPVQGPDRGQVGDGAGAAGSSEGVVAAGVNGEKKDTIRQHRHRKALVM